MACHITENGNNCERGKKFNMVDLADDSGIGIMYYINDGRHGGLNFYYKEYSDVHEGKPLMVSFVD